MHIQNLLLMSLYTCSDKELRFTLNVFIVKLKDYFLSIIIFNLIFKTLLNDLDIVLEKRLI